ncbi:MAG: glycosyltransferase, partial [Bdellovibrionales bacterium]|nr:glycosyltransferase [Bdellovibrionales bacterium]
LIGETCAVAFASEVISDAVVIRKYYERTYGRSSSVIRYGAAETAPSSDLALEQFGLEKGRYVLFVSRFEPENNPLGVVQAYRNVQSELPLVMVGDAPYAREYIRRVKEQADERVIFTGFQFGESYRSLRRNCALYIQATEVGGTHPALLEAMAYGNPIIANGTPENVEVLGPCGEYYRKNDFDHLSEKIQHLLDFPQLRSELGDSARKRARERYGWEGVVDQYESLFQELTGGAIL